MNWKDNVIIYDQLHETSYKISAGYTMLAYKFNNHPKAQEWETKGNAWNDYWNSLQGLVLNTEEEAEKEVERLYGKLREMVKVQDEMNSFQ